MLEFNEIYSLHRIENILSCSSFRNGPSIDPLPFVGYSVPGANILTPRKCVSLPF
jgi:hypothetical protein